MEALVRILFELKRRQLDDASADVRHWVVQLVSTIGHRPLKLYHYLSVTGGRRDGDQPHLSGQVEC